MFWRQYDTFWERPDFVHQFIFTTNCCTESESSVLLKGLSKAHVVPNPSSHLQIASSNICSENVLHVNYVMYVL
jgi:hypothetical protein